ncbi:MAG TPA: DinB family protein [Acidobacteriaceae bacterium]|nr:DinB family protein [Acidobacteriaceae bacterium]
MLFRTFAACCLLGISSLGAIAQMGAGSKASAPAAGTIATPAAAFDSQLRLIEEEMMGAVKAMPAEKFAFAPSAAIFVPGQKTEFATVRTFAQQATHVAEANYFFYGIISDLKPDVDVQGIEKLTKKEDVVAALAGSFAFAHKAIATLTPANAFEVIKSPEPGFQTRATLAAFGIAHAFDHYGQMVEYLRMNGIVPPASAK